MPDSPEGYENRISVFVFAQPNNDDKKVKKLPSIKNQGIWTSEFNATNPIEVWTFQDADVPKKLPESIHVKGLWGYKPGADPKKLKTDDMWFVPPKAKAPKYFTPKGMWIFPLVKRDVSVIAPEGVGFLDVSEVGKNEKLDVAGTWKVLYQRDGEPPKGPGMGKKSPVNTDPDSEIAELGMRAQEEAQKRISIEKSPKKSSKTKSPKISLRKSDGETVLTKPPISFPEL